MTKPARRRQRLFGRPSLPTYHKWAPKMKRLGLDPSEIKTGTGEPTGRTTTWTPWTA
jgi:hypothetical protein